MDKFSQKRSVTNKLREGLDLSGKSLKLFNKDFEDIMNNLREKDDSIRALVSGESIENAPAPMGGSLKDILESVKSNINRREYMRAWADLNRFHSRMYSIISIIKDLKSGLDLVHEEFLFKDLDPDTKEHLENLKHKFNAVKKAEQKYLLTSEAGKLDVFKDWYVNVSTDRGKALSAWEKRYPKKIGKLKNDTLALYNLSSRLSKITISVLKEMASARSVRSPDKYLMATDKILNNYNSYDSSFKRYYTENVQNFLEKQNLGPVVQDNGQSEQLKEQEIEGLTPKIDPKVEPRDYSKELEDAVKEVNNNKFNAPPPQKDIKDELIQRFKKDPLLNNPKPEVKPLDVITQPEIKPEIKKSHQIFYNSLNKMGNESPLILGSFIKKYANLIQKSDPETAIELFKIVKMIG